jgi:UDP-N-acetylglucosamine 4-epimerase
MQTMGLRYFNVFGPRQDPDGAYAAVIPKWIAAMLRGETVYINGDGETARDFCYIDNVVQANFLAGTVERPEALNQVYNVAVGGQTSLNELFAALRDLLAARDAAFDCPAPVHRDFRAGDVRFSRADISKAAALLGFAPQVRAPEGLEQAIEWYVARLGPSAAARRSVQPQLSEGIAD